MNGLKDVFKAILGREMRGGESSSPASQPFDNSGDARSLFRNVYKVAYGGAPGELGGRTIEQLLPSAETFTDEVKFKGVLRFLAEHPGDVGLDHIPNRMITSGLRMSDVPLVLKSVAGVKQEYLNKGRVAVGSPRVKLMADRYMALEHLEEAVKNKFPSNSQ